jgi:hypothetical protein
MHPMFNVHQISVTACVRISQESEVHYQEILLERLNRVSEGGILLVV